MRDQDTIDGLLKKLDNIIINREKDCKLIDSQYKIENGHIISKEYDQYKNRINNVITSSNKYAVDCQEKIDNLCKLARKNQPSLVSLDKGHINTRGAFPRNIVLGKYRVQFENLDFYVPKVFEFPFKKPMYICDDEKIYLIHKILLRLMFALPIDKQEYYVFDPNGLGSVIWNFNSLFENEKMFPQKKIMSSCAELKIALKEVVNYIKGLYINEFNVEVGCDDWDSYNRFLYSKKQYKKMLPYKIFIFTSVPDEMDEECFGVFRKILQHSEKCGFLVIFSFNEILLEAEDYKMQKKELELKKCLKASIQLHTIFDNEPKVGEFSKLNITSIGEKFPDSTSLINMLRIISNESKNKSNELVTFDELLNVNNLFNSKAINGLKIPIGCEAIGSAEININIDDRTPHYLIGGSTGSGKSNLLHNLIMSACWNYSPEELKLYLLDFKEGVEFNKYANPILPHAELVATEADTEYGITVLKHIVNEKNKRYGNFKLIEGCKDIKSYNEAVLLDKMPRILLIIDEFQVLFGNSQKDDTLETLTMIAKQGRACGIHLVLATQSLKGIDFGSIASQFGGRIALKCSSDDSRTLLGGMTTSNEAATELEIPFGILNTSQGDVSKNIKFATPEAKNDKITSKLLEIVSKCNNERIETKTKIFNGQKYPKVPSKEILQQCEENTLVLGEVIGFDTELLKVKLNSKNNNNLLLCGHDDKMKASFINSIKMSTENNFRDTEVIYIGNECTICSENKGYYFEDTKAFVEYYKEDYFAKRKIVILDNCDLSKELGLAPYVAKNEVCESFLTFLENANKNNCFIVAIYDGTNKYKTSSIPDKEFKHRIGYSLNTDEKNTFLNNNDYSTKSISKNRAFYAENLEIVNWFRPFM